MRHSTWRVPRPAFPEVRALGLDLGQRRVGVAVCDSAGAVATPVATMQRTRDAARDLREIAELVAEWEAEIVVVGLPRSLDGREGPAAQQARVDIEWLQEALDVPVVAHDERLTTVIAERRLAEGDLSGAARRAVVDQVAASVILQSWLDSGMPRG